MFFLLLQLLKGKLVFLWTTNVPVLATLLVLGTTGFLVTGTIPVDADDGDRPMTVVVTPLETKTCLDALIAQTEALLQLDALASDATVQLHRLRDRARESAEDRHAMIDETALRAQYNTGTAQVAVALAAARKQVLDAADLGRCQDGDPNTTVAVNVADLRGQYDAILAAFGQTLNGILTNAQTEFDRLVATAQPRPKAKDDDDEDDDD